MLLKLIIDENHSKSNNHIILMQHRSIKYYYYTIKVLKSQSRQVLGPGLVHMLQSQVMNAITSNIKIFLQIFCQNNDVNCVLKHNIKIFNKCNLKLTGMSPGFKHSQYSMVEVVLSATTRTAVHKTKKTNIATASVTHLLSLNNQLISN